MGMIKQVIFDFFGVIVDTGSVHEHKYRAGRLGVEEAILTPIVDKYWDEINRGTISTKHFWDKVGNDLGISIEDDPDELFYQSIESVFVYPEVVNLITELKKQGYTCTLLSDVFPPDAKFIRNKGRYEWFDDLILSCEVGLSKLRDAHNNSAEIFEYALKKYNCTPDEVIFVDDMPQNCASANRAGIQTVLATSPEAIVTGVKKLLLV